MMLKSQGFLLLEVVLALGVFASVGLALYALQFFLLANLQQIVARQLLIPSAIELASQLANLEPAYAETSYTDNTSSPTFDCSNSAQVKDGACSGEEYAKYMIFRWKSRLTQIRVQNVKAIVCLDDDNYATKVPSSNSANCANAGVNRVIKLLWPAHTAPGASSLEFAATGGSDNYFVVRVPK